MVKKVSALVGVFVPAIRAFQFGPAFGKIRFRRLKEVHHSTVFNHGVRKLKIAVIALQSPFGHISPAINVPAALRFDIPETP
jgi:hypothetical protein